uniref:Putative secreted peptide n=1 Tax=Anopheles braziliensis TaxID=58242 RepID=A0A2M3ZR88_9DIPT
MIPLVVVGSLLMEPLVRQIVNQYHRKLLTLENRSSVTSAKISMYPVRWHLPERTATCNAMSRNRWTINIRSSRQLQHKNMKYHVHHRPPATVVPANSITHRPAARVLRPVERQLAHPDTLTTNSSVIMRWPRMTLRRSAKEAVGAIPRKSTNRDHRR